MLTTKEIHRIARSEALRPTALLAYVGIGVVMNVPLIVFLVVTR